MILLILSLHSTQIKFEAEITTWQQIIWHFVHFGCFKFSLSWMGIQRSKLVAVGCETLWKTRGIATPIQHYTCVYCALFINRFCCLPILGFCVVVLAEQVSSSIICSILGHRILHRVWHVMLWLKALKRRQYRHEPEERDGCFAMWNQACTLHCISVSLFLLPTRLNK